MEDFGEKSALGRPVAQLIDSTMAKNLLSAGKEMLVVNGNETKDTPHHYRMSAVGDCTRHSDEALDVMEREFSYTLTTLKNAADLESIAGSTGKGVPKGMAGVYRDGSPVSEIVCDRHKAGNSRLDPEAVLLGRAASTEMNYHESDYRKVRNPGL